MGLVANVAAAQTPPAQLPGAVEPGRRELPAPVPPAAPLELKWTIRPPAGVEAPEAIREETLVLNDVVFDGVTVYDRADLLPLFADNRGREITFAEFYGIAQALQARYHADGYLLSFAYVPPQEVADGVFTIAVVEGFVDRIEVETKRDTLRGTLERVLAPITASRPLDVATLERHMLLADDLAGVQVTGILQPSKEVRGASDLIVKVVETPLDGRLAIDNRGSEFAGPWEGTAAVGASSVFGFGERLSASATVARSTEELRSFALNYTHPIGWQGLTISATAGYTLSEPGFTLKPFDVETTSLVGSLDVSYPWLRSRGESLTLGAGFSYLDTEVDLLESAFSRDRIRSLRGGLDYRLTDALGGGNAFKLEATQGLPVFSATDPDTDSTSRADTEPDFTKLSFSFARSQSVFDNWTVLLNVSGQYGFSPLPAAEEFAVGGALFGRAYNPAEVTGEHGIATSIEVAYGLAVRDLLLHRVIPYGFYDFGKAWNEGTSASAGVAQSLSSVGMGVRFDLVYEASVRLEYAHPLTRDPSNQSGEKHGRFFAFLGIRF